MVNRANLGDANVCKMVRGFATKGIWLLVVNRDPRVIGEMWSGCDDLLRI